MRSKPWDQRYTLLVGLTAAAGTLDALAFLHLGKVFTSFQSGNLLFMGLGAGAGDGGLVIRAATVLVAFVACAALGGRLIGARLRSGAGSVELEVLALEGTFLAAFALVWLGLGDVADHPVGRVVLLGIGAAAMGIQAALALALKIPNVLTVALTATIASLGQRLGTRDLERDSELPSSALLVALCATYALCALLVAALPASPVLAVAPFLLLTLAITVDVSWNEPAAVR